MMQYKRLVAFGEAMLRLSTPLGFPLGVLPTLTPTIGGAELNVAIAAAANGLPATWVSALGSGPVGDAIVDHAKRNEVTTVVQRDPLSRVGQYFVEVSTYPRPTQVHYDRAHSACALAEREWFDWDGLLDAESCLVTSGISGGISARAREIVNDAIATASRLGATVAFDINYRSRLWDRATAFEWIESLLPMIDVLVAGPTDMQLLGADPDDLATARTILGVEALIRSGKRVGPASVLLTTTVASSDGVHCSTGEGGVVDPIGAGDAVFGAFLAALPAGDVQTAVERAVRAGLLAYVTPGDAMSDSVALAPATQQVAR